VQKRTSSDRMARRKNALIERIENAALTLFEELGCEETTIEQICEAADVARKTFYNHYAGKQALIQSISNKELFAEAETSLQSACARESTARKRIGYWIKLMKKDLLQYEQLEKTLIVASFQASEDTDETRQRFARLRQGVAKIYTEGRKKGELTRDLSPVFLAELTTGSLSQIVLNWATIENYPLASRLREFEIALDKMLAP